MVCHSLLFKYILSHFFYLVFTFRRKNSLEYHLTLDLILPHTWRPSTQPRAPPPTICFANVVSRQYRPAIPICHQTSRGRGRLLILSPLARLCPLPPLERLKAGSRGGVRNWTTERQIREPVRERFGIQTSDRAGDVEMSAQFDLK